MSQRIVVIGGGLVGCGVAYQLSKRGKPVTLLERRNIVSGASGRNGGMIMKIDGRDTSPGEIAKRWVYVSQNDRILDSFSSELDEDIGLMRRGSLDIATSEKEIELLKKIVKMQKEDLGDEEIQYLDKRDLNQVSPLLGNIALGARYRPSDGCLFPFKLTHALCNKAVAMGSTVRTWTKVDQIVIEGNSVAGVKVGTEFVPAEIVINAANAWAGYLTPSVPVVPLRSLAILTEPAPPLPVHTFEAEMDSKIVYGCTQTDKGNILVGGPPEKPATQEGQFNEGVSLDEIMINSSIISTFFPELRNLNIIRAWSGAMGITPDGLPCVGKVDEVDGLYIAAGYTNGISWAPVTAQLLAELITVHDSSIPLTLLDPNRFKGSLYTWPEEYDYTVMAEFLDRKG